jgi:hypothetical protein
MSFVAASLRRTDCLDGFVDGKDGGGNRKRRRVAKVKRMLWSDAEGEEKDGDRDAQ